MEEPTKTRISFGITLTLVLSGIVLLGFLYTMLLPYRISDISERGLFGDSFGALNTLFSGLAFGAIILSLVYQRKELKYQIDEFKKSVIAQEASSESFQEQIKITNQINKYSALKDLLDETFYHYNLMAGVSPNQERLLGKFKDFQMYNVSQIKDSIDEIYKIAKQENMELNKEFQQAWSNSMIHSTIIIVQSNILLLLGMLWKQDCEPAGRLTLLSRIYNILIVLEGYHVFYETIIEQKIVSGENWDTYTKYWPKINSAFNDLKNKYGFHAPEDMKHNY